LSRYSTRFGQFLCPSPGVFHFTFGTGVYHTGLTTAFKHDQDGTGFVSEQNKTSSILVVPESCHQTCMTYTSAECRM